MDFDLKKSTGGAFSWDDVGKAAVLTGVGGAAGLLTSVGSSLLSNYLGRSQVRDNSKYLAGQDFAYAEKYAKNSPSWTVAGLRAANLNPILAATDGAFSSPTVPNVNAPVGEVSGHGQNMDVLSAYSAMQNLQMSRERTDADVSLAEAQKANVDADTRLKEVEAENKSNTHGLTGHAAWIATLFEYAKKYGFIKEPRKPVSPKSDAVKQSHHPADATFKPNFPSSSSFAKTANEIDLQIHRDNWDKEHPDYWKDHKEWLTRPRKRSKMSLFSR